MNKETLISKLEKGRAEFAYKCVQENLINLKPFEFYSEKFLEDAIAVIKETITNKMKKDIEKNKNNKKKE